MSNWRKWIMPGLLVIASSARADLPEVSIPPATDLAREGRTAEQGCMPLLLMFSALYCDYCTLLEEEVLKPMLRNRDYDRRVLMRKLTVDSPHRISDFSGKPTDAASVSDRHRVYVTPTLLFVDGTGVELAERMIGVTTLDFYGGYLDQALQTATARLRQLGRCGAGSGAIPDAPSDVR